MANDEVRTFDEEVEGIGKFTFRHATVRDSRRILAEYSRVCEGCGTPTPFLDAFASQAARVKVLTESAPKGWNVDDIDPLQPEQVVRLYAVYAALVGAEARFRGAAPSNSPGPGPEDVGNDQVLVPPDVPPPAK